MYKVLFFLIAIALLLSCADTPSTNDYLQNVRQLTTVGDNGEAYWSPDGRQLIFQSKRDGHGCDKIYIMDADGSNQHRVGPELGAHTCSYFSADMERILFASTLGVIDSCPPRPRSEHGEYIWPLFPYDIYSARPDGSDLVRIREHDGYDAEPTVCFKTGRVIFTSQVDGDLELHTMNVDGSDVQRLTFRLGYDGGPYFSPDGEHVVWRAWYPTTAVDSARWLEDVRLGQVLAVPLDIYVMNADGSGQLRLTNNGATNWAPSWHPDGQRIVFSSNMDDWNDEHQAFGHNFELYMISRDGTGLKRLTHNTYFDSFPMFDPAGKRLAFASNRDADNPRATHVFVADWVE